MYDLNFRLFSEATLARQSPRSHPYTIQIMRRSRSLYWHMQALGFLCRVLNTLSVRKTRLLPLVTQPDEEAKPINGHYAGMQSVPIQRILGSEGRCRDFDRHFHPLTAHTRERWIALATAWQMGSKIPAVTLIQRGNTYYVRDGHHRISVAQALGYRYIDAEVIAWQSVAAPSQLQGPLKVSPAQA